MNQKGLGHVKKLNDKKLIIIFLIATATTAVSLNFIVKKKMTNKSTINLGPYEKYENFQSGIIIRIRCLSNMIVRFQGLIIIPAISGTVSAASNILPISDKNVDFT